ncbi:uncharacterized protein LOC115549646 [Gadus morhua]|uniref:Uncharacterized LOC115549646 n=1 Tax=Gadus morhua TaxID=8049 RepID=A0A8C5B634_GADMO|nr:uncharacterized protein LOC115549646 [Gadus morhua]XP_030220827.1 uncharacterized protein LOC115549646 [Gadus morhua]
MEKEELVDKIQNQSVPIIFPPPHGINKNWSFLSAPSLEPFPSFPPPPLSFSSACTSLPTTSAAHVLQTKVKTVTQRKQRGREKFREPTNTDVQAKQDQTGQLQWQVSLKPGVPAKGAELSGPWSVSGSGMLDFLSGVDSKRDAVPEGQGVRVRLEIHSPPAGAQRRLSVGSQPGVMGKVAETERSEAPPVLPRGLGEGASLESLLSDNRPRSRKHEPLTPPPLPVLSVSPSSSCASPATLNAPSSSSSSSSTPPPPAPSSSSPRHWAPPKGFWRVVRPETLLLNGLGTHDSPAALGAPSRDPGQKTEATGGPTTGGPTSGAEPQRRSKPAGGEAACHGRGVAVAAAASDSDADPLKFKHSDSLECYWDQLEQKQVVAGGRVRTSSLDSVSSLSSSSQSEAKPRAGGRSKVRRRRSSREEREQGGRESGGHSEAEGKGAYESLENDSDSTALTQDIEPNSSLLFMLPDDLPLSPRHEQAKVLLERARLKARCNHTKGDRPPRRAHSDQRGSAKQLELPANPPTQKPQRQQQPQQQQQQRVIQAREEAPSTPPAPVSLLIQEEPQVSCLAEQGARPRRNGSSPTRVRFEDESQRDAQSRYLDRVRERGRSGNHRSKAGKAAANSADSAGSSPDRGRGHRSASTPASQWRQEEVSITSAAGGVTTTTTTTVIKEIIVVVKKCEACGSTVREHPAGASDTLWPPPPSPPPPPPEPEPEPQQSPVVPAEEPRGKGVSRAGPPGKQEASARPKQPLTVTFAGAFILGENKEGDGGWSSSGFGKLRRRSLKGQSRLEAGNGPYGASWVHRRNSNPRNRTLARRAVSFAPGSPVDLELRVCEAPGGPGEPQGPPLPIKSALKSSSKNRGLAAAQSQGAASQAGAEGCGPQSADPLETAEARREGPPPQGGPGAGSLVPCIRPSSLKYSSARIGPDLPPADLWDVTPDGPGMSQGGDPGCEGRPSPRCMALSRAEDLRAELLRAEHLKAEAQWDAFVDTPSPRKVAAERDGRSKLSLRRFFSSIGLNSVGKLVKGRRSSSMEQLSLPADPRGAPGSPSPSPTRRLPAPGRLQRTPSLQSLHSTVLPLAQLRKASSVQSLEKRTERSTTLAEVQIPYGLAPSPASPQVELRRGLSVEEVPVTSRTVRPVGKVAQASPDGTLLLELTRPPNEPFGFLISRGKGRANTGVYIEKVGSSVAGVDGPYAGLLGVGDEILQVNGEPVAGLTLDQVTRLMTRGESTACLRVMPCRRGGPPLKPKPTAGHAP